MNGEFRTATEPLITVFTLNLYLIESGLLDAVAREKTPILICILMKAEQTRLAY